MNIVSFRATVPAIVDAVGPPLVFGEIEVLLQLPGPYISGIQVWTDQFVIETPDLSDISLRLIEPPAGRIFPEPSMTIMVPLTEVPRPEVERDSWYHPVETHWTDISIIVSGDQRYRVICHLINYNAADVDVIVNLKVSAKPPDETTIQLIKEMNAGIERWMNASTKVMKDAIQAAIQQGLKR